jgi:hypothetical protein
MDISNAPFAQPDLDVLLGGFEFVIANACPVRGTYRLTVSPVTKRVYSMPNTNRLNG